MTTLRIQQKRQASKEAGEGSLLTGVTLATVAGLFGYGYREIKDEEKLTDNGNEVVRVVTLVVTREKNTYSDCVV